MKSRLHFFKDNDQQFKQNQLKAQLDILQRGRKKKAQM